MARIFESAPKLPKEKSVKGIALFVTANNKECFHENFNNDESCLGYAIDIYQETINKAKGMLKAIALAERIQQSSSPT